MKALVTGATGFIGSHLAERLLAEGLEVACLVRRTSDPAWIRDLPVERRLASLEEPQALLAAVGGVDYVFHVAGLTRARSREAYFAVNAEGTRRLLAAAIRSGVGLRRFVLVSSLAAIGPAPADVPVDETAAPRPIDDYGASKLAGERIVLAEAGRLPVTIVRPPGVYGPRDRNFLPLFRAVCRFGAAPIVGRPSKQASLVHAADLADGIWRAASTPQAVGQTYFLAGGTHTYREVAGALSAAVGVRLRVWPVPSFLAQLAGELGELKWVLTGKPQILSRRKVRDMLQARWICSWAKARRELGYRERIGLAEGMRQTAEWYADQGWLRRRRQRGRAV